MNIHALCPHVGILGACACIVNNTMVCSRWPPRKLIQRFTNAINMQISYKIGLYYFMFAHCTFLHTPHVSTYAFFFLDEVLKHEVESEKAKSSSLIVSVSKLCGIMPCQFINSNGIVNHKECFSLRRIHLVYAQKKGTFF